MSQLMQEDSSGAPTPRVDVDAIRRQFPILDQQVKGKPLVYLDNAASSQKPLCVIDAIAAYYRTDHANVHRGVHTLSERATDAYEGARERCRAFIGASSSREIVFTRGTTESINLVAASFGETFVKSGDTVLVTEMEHHSNIVPWQMLCRRTGAELAVAPMRDTGELDLDAFDRQLEKQPVLVAIGHVSNALGTVNPVAELVRRAHDAGAKVLIDGAQAVPHLGVDVRALDCDFYAFSGHKMYGPTGIGVLYGRESLLDAMHPWQGGGEMIREVTFEHTEFNVLPHKFEAGTPNVSGAVGLAAAIDFMQDVGVRSIAGHESELLRHAGARAAERDWFRVVGNAAAKAGVMSFTIDGAHPNDIGMMLDADGFAVRAGHHCAMPVMQHYDVPATVRASLAVYNTRDEIDRLFASIDKVRDLLC